jgi:hypothetical protein
MTGLGEGAGITTKMLEGLKDLPLWLLGGLAVASAVLLSFPSIAASLPIVARPWIVIAAVVFGVAGLCSSCTAATKATPLPTLSPDNSQTPERKSSAGRIQTNPDELSGEDLSVLVRVVCERHGCHDPQVQRYCMEAARDILEAEPEAEAEQVLTQLWVEYENYCSDLKLNGFSGRRSPRNTLARASGSNGASAQRTCRVSNRDETGNDVVTVVVGCSSATRSSAWK